MFRRVFLIGGAIAAVLVVAVGGLYYVGAHKGGGEFVFTRLDIDTSKPQAEACLAFSRGLDLTGRTHYEDYLTIDPKTRIVVHAVDQRLCISGLSFNQTYTVTLKVGLPSANGLKLTEAETIPVELRDKPALVR